MAPLPIQRLLFPRSLFVVRNGKGDKDRVTVLPDSRADALRELIESRRRQHAPDLADGLGEGDFVALAFRRMVVGDWG